MLGEYNMTDQNLVSQVKEANAQVEVLQKVDTNIAEKKLISLEESTSDKALASINDALEKSLNQKEVEEKVDTVVDKILSVNLNDPTIQSGLIAGLEKTNEKIITKAKSFNSKKLDAAMSKLQGTDGNAVFDQMIGLNAKLKEIHPSQFDLENGFLGKIFPFLSKTRNYFKKFQSTNSLIAEMQGRLEKAIQEQKMDMEFLKEDKIQLMNIAVGVRRAIEFNMKLKSKLEYRLNELEDEEAKKFLESQLIFNVTREIQGLQELLTVNLQGQQSFEMLLRSGKDLMESANRCINVSISAVKIAAIVAHVVSGQKKMLAAIKEVNATAEMMIKHNADVLGSTLKDIGQQAVSTNLNVDVLVQAIDKSVQAIEDDIKFRREALPKMNENIQKLATASNKAQKSVDEMAKARGQNENFSEEAAKIISLD